jgi:hypothetical protein
VRHLAALVLVLALAMPACAGRPFTVGLNYPWHQENGQHLYGALFGDLTDARKAAIQNHFADMQGAGITRLRIWLLADGWRWPERVDGHFRPLPERFISDLRWFLRAAHARGILVQPAIWDFYINRTHREYLTDPAVLPEIARVVIEPLVAALAGEPGLDSWDVMNEPEWIIDFGRGENVADERAPTRGFEPGPPHPFGVLRNWISKHVEIIKRHGTRVTVGSAGTKWVHHWKGLGLDEYQVHFYPKPTTSWMGDAMFWFLPAVSRLGLDKPCVLGEFPPNHKRTNLVDVLTTIKGKGYAGAWAWEYFGDGFPENLAHPFSYRARRDEFRAFTGR